MYHCMILLLALNNSFDNRIQSSRKRESATGFNGLLNFLLYS
jgi:hypothetical protein